MRVCIHGEKWPLKTPLNLTRHSFDTLSAIIIELASGDLCGRGEAAQLYYNYSSFTDLIEQANAVSRHIENGADRATLQKLLPPGVVRNAIDCAMWDIEAKRAGRRVWDLLHFSAEPLPTCFTIGDGEPDRMAAAASAESGFSTLKVILTSDRPIEKLRAVRKARRDAALIVDVHQGWTFDELRAYEPDLESLGVCLIEQPLAVERDEVLASYDGPIPLCADETCRTIDDLDYICGRYQAINIKLDETGGLTSALDLAYEAKRRGLQVVVGCMLGTSLGIAPAFVVGQIADYVDLDAPRLLVSDRRHALSYKEGRLFPPQTGLWG